MSQAKGTILVVEDEENIAALVSMYLEREGYRPILAGTASGALREFTSARPRLVILDIGLPDGDGIEVCKTIRNTSNVPVIFLTARDSEIDRVVGLELGADDYVTKPFSPAELMARVRAVLRRSDDSKTTDVVQVGPITVDLGSREVRVGDDAVELTTREFDLLVYFADHKGLALSRQQLLDGVWGFDWYGDTRTVDVHVGQLRRKLAPHFEVSTVRGIGYRLDHEPRQ